MPDQDPEPEDPSAPSSDDEPNSSPDTESENNDYDSDGATNEHSEFYQLNNFYAAVNSHAIGFAAAANPFARSGIRRESGSLSASEANEKLLYYLAPPMFGQALRTLADRHIVALTGPEGCGKKAGTIKLAQHVCQDAKSYVVLPPTRSLAELAESKIYKPGNMYLLHDWVPIGADAGSIASYDLDQLIHRLSTAKAYMAISLELADQLQVTLGDLCHRWSAPQAITLIEHCIQKIPQIKPTEEELEQITARAAELSAPRLIVDLAELAKEKGITAALSEIGHVQNKAIADWFMSNPVRWKVWAVAALTFLSGVTEREYERTLAVLTEIDRLRNSASAGGHQDEKAEVPGDDDPFPQRRWDLANDAYLRAFITERVSFGPVGSEHRSAFRTVESRLRFMIELNARFGDALWSPIHDWLSEMADQPFGQVQIAAGYGLALLARCALREVENTYLIPWSRKDLRHRLMAVNVLWAMAEDDQCAPAALRIAVSWVQNKGQERAITAAIAFGGPLGSRYPDEALRWLWKLSLRSERIGSIARAAMSQLFAVEADLNLEQSAVLSYLLRRIRKVFKEEQATRLEYRKRAVNRRRAALSVANSVLGAEQIGSSKPVMIRVLRSSPADFDAIAQLWAVALNSVPHRKDAILALHATLLNLADDASSVDLATRLGSRLLPRLTTRTYQVLQRTLADPQRAEQISSSVAAAFLGTSRPEQG